MMNGKDWPTNSTDLIIKINPLQFKLGVFYFINIFINKKYYEKNS